MNPSECLDQCGQLNFTDSPFIGLVFLVFLVGIVWAALGCK